MIKLAHLALAISFCRPALAASTGRTYAEIVSKRSTAIAFDPLLFVAHVEHESGWREDVVNPKSGALGLGQILPAFRPECSKGGPACAAEKKKLLDGAHNLSAAFDALGAWRTFCKQKTGRAGDAQILQAYQGLNDPKTGLWCGARRSSGGEWILVDVPALTKNVFKRARALRLRLEAMGG